MSQTLTPTVNLSNLQLKKDVCYNGQTPKCPPIRLAIKWDMRLSNLGCVQSDQASLASSRICPMLYLDSSYTKVVLLISAAVKLVIAKCRTVCENATSGCILDDIVESLQAAQPELGTKTPPAMPFLPCQFESVVKLLQTVLAELWPPTRPAVPFPPCQFESVVKLHQTLQAEV